MSIEEYLEALNKEARLGNAPDLLRKMSIARKRHRCHICDQWIEAGEKQETFSALEHGEGYSTCHMHPECSAYSKKWTLDEWESHIPGDVSRKEAQ